MSLAEVPETRRADGELPGANERAVDGDGVVDAGVTDVGVVEEVVDAGLPGAPFKPKRGLSGAPSICCRCGKNCGSLVGLRPGLGRFSRSRLRPD